MTGYLPARLSAEEIGKVVDETAAELVKHGTEIDGRNMGKLMGAVMAKVKGVADGDVVRKVVEEKLR